MFNDSDIFTIASDAEFEREALQLFRFQAEHCEPYAEYIRLLGVEPSEIRRRVDYALETAQGLLWRG